MILNDAESKALLAARGISAVRGVGMGSVSLALDRDRRGHRIIAEAGGRRLEQFVDPVVGMQPFMARRAAGHLGLEADRVPGMAKLLGALYELALADALRVDVGVTKNMEVTRAFLWLDAAARFRHPEWARYGERLEGTPAEQEFRRVGAVAAEPDPHGTIVAVVSGAGLMMTAVDMLAARGARIRCIVDMQGLPLQGAKGMTPIFALVGPMAAKATVIAGRFQAPVAHNFAEAVVEASKTAPLTGRVVTWIVGNMADEAAAICRGAGYDVLPDFNAALDAAVAAAG